jgi:hypothetical protein
MTSLLWRARNNLPVKGPNWRKETSMKKLLTASAAALIGSLAMVSAANADDKTKPHESTTSNGSSDRGGTTYHPVYTGSNGASAGVIVQPQPGTPQSAPANGYGVGGRIPLPGG